jgi:hypothetical protein
LKSAWVVAFAVAAARWACSISRRACSARPRKNAASAVFASPIAG